MLCVDYIHCTRLYTDVLHYIHCVVLHRVCQITTQYSDNFFTSNLEKFTPGKKIYTDAVLGVLDKYQVCSTLLNVEK